MLCRSFVIHLFSKIKHVISKTNLLIILENLLLVAGGKEEGEGIRVFHRFAALRENVYRIRHVRQLK